MLCKPAFSVPTLELFARLDGVRILRRPDTAGLLSALAAVDLAGVARRMYNVFEDALPPRRAAEIQRLKTELIQQGALGACMSGTGPTVFGMFRDEAGARQAERALRGQWPETWAVQNICP